MRPSIKEWHVFTKVWLENVRHLGRDPHPCRLAIAMASADGQRQRWDYYLQLAQHAKTHQEEMDDARLQRRLAAMQVEGWALTFDGHGWSAMHADGLSVCEKTLTALLAGVEEWGQGMRRGWGALPAAGPGAEVRG